MRKLTPLICTFITLFFMYLSVNSTPQWKLELEQIVLGLCMINAVIHFESYFDQKTKLYLLSGVIWIIIFGIQSAALIIRLENEKFLNVS